MTAELMIRPATTRREGRVRVGDGDIVYTIAGAGEPLLLIHGLGATRRTWDHLIDELARTHTVIAPDLPGHGDSGAPAGDYSLGALAASLRDLLVALGHPSATIVGHSLGGGIGMQFAYQFPERTDRLVLISSGGLGRQLTPALRAATLPGARAFIAAAARAPEWLTRWLLSGVAAIAPALLAGADAAPVAEGLRRLGDRRERRTFLRTARTVINWRGQSVSATQHLKQLAGLPVLLAWGGDDRVIPPQHHLAVAGTLTDCQVLEIGGAGHYPQETAPGRLLPGLHRFLDSAPRFDYTEARWRRLLTA
ncbi:alpha/beta fold hydrolase [Actinoplanes sp. NPDC026619]|uniref:alpha/beta fold hydrolase n=1 Tax=Actinoplanes sp. NPDC026619 TaxID=3155798 RepID=UPI0033F5E445